MVLNSQLGAFEKRDEGAVRVEVNLQSIAQRINGAFLHAGE